MEEIIFSSELSMVPELGHHFSIRLKAPNSKIEIIVCKEVGLEIEVMPNPGKDTHPSDMTLVMVWYHKTPDGNVDLENYDSVFFTILEQVEGADNSNWSMKLFEEAINWYVINHLQKEPAGFQGLSHIMLNFYSDYEDGFEQAEPWSEEEREFQRHISDEQRKFNTANQVAKSAGIETWPDDDPLPF
jgi:hypothetical protein